MSNLNITVLTENSAKGRGLLAEHGLSFWIEEGDKKILFDTGQGLALKHNAQHLGINLVSADAIVLSHGHYDHTSGLPDALAGTMGRPVFLHPDALSTRYTRNPDGTAREVGMSKPVAGIVQCEAQIYRVEQPTQLTEKAWCTGPIPRTNEYEDTGGPFFKDKECRVLDEILDDQAVFIETETGTVVVLGCAHSGVINTLHYIQKLTNNKPVCAVLGGMHLLNADSQRMQSTLAELHRLPIQRLSPCHCTGFQAMASLSKAFPAQYEAVGVGSVLQF